MDEYSRSSRPSISRNIKVIDQLQSLVMEDHDTFEQTLFDKYYLYSCDEQGISFYLGITEKNFC